MLDQLTKRLGFFLVVSVLVLSFGGACGRGDTDTEDGDNLMMSFNGGYLKIWNGDLDDETRVNRKVDRSLDFETRSLRRSSEAASSRFCDSPPISRPRTKCKCSPKLPAGSPSCWSKKAMSFVEARC